MTRPLIQIRRGAALLSLLLAALLGGAAGSWATAKRSAGGVPLFLAAPPQASSGAAGLGYAEVVKKTAPAVASVLSTRVTKAPEMELIRSTMKTSFKLTLRSTPAIPGGP